MGKQHKGGPRRRAGRMEMTAEGKNQELPWHLKGNWAPVQDELEVSGLEVEGEIPYPRG